MKIGDITIIYQHWFVMPLYPFSGDKDDDSDTIKQSLLPYSDKEDSSDNLNQYYQLESSAYGVSFL